MLQGHAEKRNDAQTLCTCHLWLTDGYISILLFPSVLRAIATIQRRSPTPQRGQSVILALRLVDGRGGFRWKWDTRTWDIRE